MSRDDIIAGIEACGRHEECPENASEGFQRGYGTAYAAQEARPPIPLESVIEQFERIFSNE